MKEGVEIYFHRGGIKFTEFSLVQMRNTRPPERTLNWLSSWLTIRAACKGLELLFLIILPVEGVLMSLAKRVGSFCHNLKKDFHCEVGMLHRDKEMIMVIGRNGIDADAGRGQLCGDHSQKADCFQAGVNR